MMDFAYREGYTHLPQLDFRPINVRKDEVGRRDIFALDETERTKRLMVRDAILIASNSLH